MAAKSDPGYVILSEQQDDKNHLITLSKAVELYTFNHNYLAMLARENGLQAQKLGSEWLTTMAPMKVYTRGYKQTGRYHSDVQMDKEGL